MNLPPFFNQVRAHNTYVLSAGLALLFGGLLAVLIFDTTNWWNITLIVLGSLALVLFVMANVAEVKAVGKKRSTAVKANLTLVSLAMFGIVLALNFIVARHPVRFDLTSNKIYSLSDQTLEALKKLPQDVDVTMFTSARRSQAGIEKAKELLEEYSKHSTKFHFKTVDVDRKPAEARQLNVTEVNTVVFQSGDNRKDVLQRDYLTYAMGQGRQPTEKFQGEGAFTQALLKMTDTSHIVFYFTQGHGEKDLNNPQPDGFNEFKNMLDKQNYETKSVTLLTSDKIPDDATVLVSLGPQQSFQPSEEKLISDYLGKGGKFVLFVDPIVHVGLEALLKDYGIKLGNDMVVDPTMYVPPDPRNVVPQYSYHAIVEKMSGSNILTVMPYMRSVQQVDPGIKGVSQTVFLKTSDKGWGVTDLKAKSLKHSPGDTKGPVPLAMACELTLPDNPAKKARVVVYGGSNFLTNNFLQAPGNGDLGVNTLSWAAEEENKISIHPKEDEARIVNLTSVSANIMFYLPVILIPAGTLLLGILVWYRRRSL